MVSHHVDTHLYVSSLPLALPLLINTIVLTNKYTTGEGNETDQIPQVVLWTGHLAHDQLEENAIEVD